MLEYRCTIPSLYPPGSLGHKDPVARQGYYIVAGSAEEAAAILKGRLTGVDQVEAMPWKPTTNNRQTREYAEAHDLREDPLY